MPSPSSTPASGLQIFSTGPDERLLPYYRRMVDPKSLRLHSKQEWIQRRAVVRERTLAALGLNPLPDRLPLDVRRGGTLEREGYRVERLYWQTWPGVFASGWLYLPTSPGALDTPVPAVLNPHGHWENGARHPVVQSRLIGLAKLGYVALAVDSVHVYDYSTGLTPLSAMTYANLRALDLLCGMPEVDRERIGITGASGGAQQAMYLLALDDRPKAAVLAVLVTYFQRIMMPEGHHCACNHVPGLMRFTDQPELCAVASPKALQFLTVTGDWTAPFPEHELGELRSVYRLWGQEDRLSHQQFPGPHDYNQEMRETAYTWFERELRGNRKAAPVMEPEHTVEELETLNALDARPEGDLGPDGIIAWYRKRVVAQPPQLESKQSRRNYQERARTELAELLGEPTPIVTLETELHREMKVGARAAQLVSFRSEPDVRIPAVWVPGTVPRPWRSVLALHPEGKLGALNSPLVRGLLDAGYAVLAPDVRLRGEQHREWLQNSLLWGRPEAGMAATDAGACVQWLLEREEVDPRSVLVVGEGDQGITALLAMSADERIAGGVADCLGTTYRDGGEGLPVIPNVLRVADVPQIASLAAPRPLWLYRVPEDRVGFSSRRYFDWTRRTFQSLGDVDALKMTTGAAPDAPILTGWLDNRLRRSR